MIETLIQSITRPPDDSGTGRAYPLIQTVGSVTP